MKKTVPTIAIIGGGAAGMMAAATLLESDKACRVLLFEKNKALGAKVIISGGGRCNVTTGFTNRQQLLKKYNRGSEFLKAAMSKFPPEKCFEWFEAHGVPLKTEKDLRVFPKSNDGHDIVGVFEHLFKQAPEGLHLLTSVSQITKYKNGFSLVTSKGLFDADAVIITTGGNAYRHTGSTGDGYAFAQALGHSLTELGPSLNSFAVAEHWVKELSGLSLPWARLKYKKAFADGPLLFTHFGISGPVTFSLSAKIPYETISTKSPLKVQLFPDASRTSFEEWEAYFLDTIQKEGKKQVQTIIQQFFPKRLASTLLLLANVRSTTPLLELSKENRKRLSHLLSGDLLLTLTMRRPGDEFVTAGGVSTKEINPQTMESLLTPGLYFGGEVMDIDGETGGFNLQASWATGRLAAISVLKNIA